MPPLALSSPSLERNLAVIRLALAIVLLGAELLSAPFGAAAVLALGYAVVAVGAVWLLPRDRDVSPSIGRRLHVVDLAITACLPVLSDGPLVHFFPLFVLVAAAYRWGVRQTILSGLVAVVGIALDGDPGLRAKLVHTGSPNHLVIVGGYTLVFAVLVGHIAQRETRVRAESAALARLFGRIRLDAGPVPSLRAALREVQALFGASQVLLAVHDTETDSAYLWRGRTHDGTGRRVPALEEIAPVLRQRYYFPVARAVDACALQASGTRDFRVVAALDENGRAVANAAVSLPATFAAAHRASRVWCLPHLSIDGLRLRLFVIDPAGERPEGQLRLLWTLARRVTPVLHNLFLDRRLHAVMLNDERARVARELHDGLIQSLIGIEMRLDVARRMVASAPSRAAVEVEQIQHLLRAEIVDVRALMEGLRSHGMEQRRLLDFLSETTTRFGTTTGIRTRFVPSVDEIRLPSRVCHELARVVDEALVNVRKHSGAQNVAVTVGSTGEGLTLSVEDDGRGFGFDGRMTQVELDTSGVGPLVIKERVQAMGGRLAIDSRPGFGARLEVMVPRYATD